jgi:hypothetical protein
VARPSAPGWVHRRPSRRVVAGTCRPTEADLLRAAYAARQLEAEHPELFEQSPRPAGYDDLRLAAEWARRLEVLSPQDQC